MIAHMIRPMKLEDIFEVVGLSLKFKHMMEAKGYKDFIAEDEFKIVLSHHFSWIATRLVDEIIMVADAEGQTAGLGGFVWGQIITRPLWIKDRVWLYLNQLYCFQSGNGVKLIEAIGQIAKDEFNAVGLMSNLEVQNQEVIDKIGGGFVLTDHMYRKEL